MILASDADAAPDAARLPATRAFSPLLLYLYTCILSTIRTVPLKAQNTHTGYAFDISIEEIEKKMPICSYCPTHGRAHFSMDIASFRPSKGFDKPTIMKRLTIPGHHWFFGRAAPHAREARSSDAMRGLPAALQDRQYTPYIFPMFAFL